MKKWNTTLQLFFIYASTFEDFKAYYTILRGQQRNILNPILEAIGYHLKGIEHHISKIDTI